MNQNRSNKHATDESFEFFFHGWLVRQEHYLQRLLQIDHPNEQETDDTKRKELITEVMAHYSEYYEIKSKFNSNNVFILFSPPWFNCLELPFLWIAGFKPSLVFGLVNNSVLDLTNEQASQMQVVAKETKGEEKGLAKQLALIQEDVAAPAMMALARGVGTCEKDVAVEGLAMRMEELVGNADTLRSKTVGEVMDILSGAQNVKFLVGAAQLMLSIRASGIQRDADQKKKPPNF